MRLPKFALISGCGWLMDVLLMTGLVGAGLTPFVANCISAAVAVTFVFTLAQRRVFLHDGTFVGAKFGIYAAFNVCMVLLASAIIGALSGFLLTFTARFPELVSLAGAPGDASLRMSLALLSKIAVTPVTLYCNFLFMGWLLEGKLSFR